ncbi:MAG: flagellar basal body L-ring protein FlgH [Planctomycetes bacterium]|nr:flagellar basal body L-ring protein FlgH [Planctomycetota bacterium]
MNRIVTALWLVLAAMPASAQLIGQDDDGSPLDPPKKPPFRKHDHIRILVVERSTASTQSTLQSDRRSRTEMEFNKFVNFETRGTALPRIFATNLTDDPGINIDARYRRDNSGKTNRNVDLTFVVTAEIVDIRPNGNLVLEAKKRRKINADVEEIRLTGEVSPNFVVNRTVKSEDIVNQSIEVSGSGPASDVSKPGWLGWLLDKLWPF